MHEVERPDAPQPFGRAPLRELDAWLAAAERRLFWQKLEATVPRAAGRFVPVLAALVAGLLLLGQAELARALLGVGIAILILNLLVWRRPRLTRLTAALELDRRLGPGSALGPAYAFSRQTSSELGPYERFVVESELHKARRLDLSKWLPWEKRLGPWLDIVNLFVVASLALVQPPPRASSPPSPEPSALGPAIYPVDELRAHLEEVGPLLQSEPATEVFEQAKATLDRLARGEASAEHTLLALKDLEGSIERSAAEARGISESLEETGRALERARLTQPLGKALRERRLDDAARAAAQLEERLLQGTARLNSSELDKLRQDLTRRVEARSESAEASRAQAKDDELSSSLRKRRQALQDRARKGPLSPSERAEKAEIERRLATLERRKKAAEETQMAESELDRQLAEAARALSEEAREQGQGTKPRAQRYAEGARESLRQLQNKTLTDAEKQALLSELRRMKERLGEGGQEAEQARAALRAFEQRARQAQARDQNAEAKSGESPASRAESGASAREGAEGDSGQATTALGERSTQPGGGHDENLLRKDASPETKTGLDVSAAAQDLRGESDAEVVERAARRGFTSPFYRRLYLEYRAIDEEVMARDQVPPGYASRVLRYFELIEPAVGAD